MAEPTPLPPGATADRNPHPRDAEVEEAARDLLTFLGPWTARHQLSVMEYCFLFTTVVIRQLQNGCIVERDARPVRKVGDPP